MQFINKKSVFAYNYNIENSEIYYYIELVEKHNLTEQVKK
jgi:hypothetical protein